MLLYMHVLRLITNRKYYILLCCYIIQIKYKFFRSIVSSKELLAVSGGHYTVSPPLIQRSRRGATVMGRSCRYRPTFSLGLSYSWTFRWTWIPLKYTGVGTTHSLSPPRLSSLFFNFRVPSESRSSASSIEGNRQPRIHLPSCVDVDLHQVLYSFTCFSN